MEIKTDIKPTEDPKKVKEAVLNILPNADIRMGEDRAVLKGEASFEEFWNRLTEQRIRETVLDCLKDNKSKGKTYLSISKTAASSGKVSTYVGSSIGDIKLFIPWQEVESV